MRSPVDTVKGRIVDVDERGVTIRVPYDDYNTLIRREYKEVKVTFVDSRPVSDKQRRACWMILGAIAEWAGYSKTKINDLLKIRFLVDELQETGAEIFSLSDAPMSLVCAYQRFLVEFVVDNDVPCSFRLLDFVDDVEAYVYACLAAKKCCVCGKKADLHHVDHVGMGRDRDEIIHEGMRVLPLCREHHTEAHTAGEATFEERYHLTPIEADKTICKIYGLKTRRKTDA